MSAVTRSATWSAFRGPGRTHLRPQATAVEAGGTSGCGFWMSKQARPGPGTLRVGRFIGRLGVVSIPAVEVGLDLDQRVVRRHVAKLEAAGSHNASSPPEVDTGGLNGAVSRSSSPTARLLQWNAHQPRRPTRP